MNRLITAAIVVLTLLSSEGLCQIPRYELGKRVKRFERNFESAMADDSVRKKVLPHLQAAVTAFFSLRATEAGVTGLPAAIGSMGGLRQAREHAKSGRMRSNVCQVKTTRVPK